MTVTFFDRQNESNYMNGHVIHVKKQLGRLLYDIAARPPFFCELISSNGYNLLIGVGKPYGCAQYSSSDGAPPYLMATRGNVINDDQYIEFLIGDTPTPVSVKYCLPFSDIEQIAFHFLDTGERAPTVIWEEI